MVKVLSVGGSIVVPEHPDTMFLSRFTGMIREWLSCDASRKLILVIGGGGPARIYQQAYRDILADVSGAPVAGNEQADWIGIMATRLNAQLLRAVFADLCCQDVVCDPTQVSEFSGRVLVAAGWKPGFSTDNDAVLLAERFAAKTVINLSNIEKVYTDDPRKNPEAQPLDVISWQDFRAMIGDEWTPGKNTPFDPVASRRAQNAGISVICAGGRDIENIRRILDDKSFTGTRIG
jgi:uridylate kinase